MTENRTLQPESAEKANRALVFKLGTFQNESQKAKHVHWFKTDVFENSNMLFTLIYTEDNVWPNTQTACILDLDKSSGNEHTFIYTRIT